MKKQYIHLITFIIPIIYIIIYNEKIEEYNYGIVFIITTILIKLFRCNKSIKNNYNIFLFNIGLVNILVALLLYNTDIIKLMDGNKYMVINTLVLLLILIVEAQTNSLLKKKNNIKERLILKQESNTIDENIEINKNKKEIKKAKLYGIMCGIIVLVIININIIFKGLMLLILIIIISTPGNSH